MCVGAQECGERENVCVRLLNVGLLGFNPDNLDLIG
jgi:hypothetical protein